MDFPVILGGVGTVVALFIAMRYLEFVYGADKNTAIKIVFGIFSGIIMNILSELYKVLNALILDSG